MARTETSKRTISEKYALHSRSNADLGVFLVFLGTLCSVPLSNLFCKLVLRIPSVDWRIGLSLGLVVAAVGLALMAFTRATYRVVKEGAGGYIEVRDGLLRGGVRYAFAGTPEIRLQGVESENVGDNRCVWQVTLVDGKYHYLLDSRVERQTESRGLAEFLCKTIECPFILHLHNRTIKIAHEDLDLPFYERAQRYPELLGKRVDPEDARGVTVRDLDGGTGREYSWGVLGAGILVNTVGVFFAVLLFGLLPVFGDVGDHYSLLETARSSGNYIFFVGTLALGLVIVAVQCGYSGRVSVRGEAVIGCISIWGIKTWLRSIPIECLEEVSVRARTSGASLVLISDDMVAAVRMGGMMSANFVCGDLGHFLVERLGQGRKA